MQESRAISLGSNNSRWPLGFPPASIWSSRIEMAFSVISAIGCAIVGTHDQVEAMTMADTIVALRDGIIEQAGSPIELYARPRNRFVASFLGSPQMNMLAATRNGAAPSGIRLAIDQGRGAIELLCARAENSNAGAFTVGVRPEHVSPAEEGLAAKVDRSEILGAETIIHATLASGERLVSSLRGIRRVGEGEQMRFAIDHQFVHVFDDEGRSLTA